MSGVDNYGSIDLDSLLADFVDDTESLGFDSIDCKSSNDSGSSDDGSLSLFSNTSPSYSPPQQSNVSPLHGNVSPNDITLDYLLPSPTDPYTDQFIENIIDEAKKRPCAVYSSNYPRKSPPRSVSSVPKRPSPYPVPGLEAKRASVEEISTIGLDKRIRKTPVKEQKIHATDKCQIVKIEPEICDSLSLETQEMLGVTGSGVLVKVEPQVPLNTAKPQFKHPAKEVVNRPDILSQACHAHSIGMNSRGQIYKRTAAQIRAEERKIRNRQSASISRLKKKQHLEETEARNKDLAAENSRLRRKNLELEEEIKRLTQLVGFNQSGPPKRIIVSSMALFSIAFVGFLSYPNFPMQNGVSISRATDVAFPSASPAARKLMSINEMEQPWSADGLKEFWLDDVLHTLRNNEGFTSLLKLVQTGPIDVRRMVQRKLYEEFKISFRELRKSYPHLKFQRQRGFQPPIGIENAGEKKSTVRSARLPPRAPKLENQMCEPKVDGKEIHRVFKTWRSGQLAGGDEEPQTQQTVENAKNETGLIHGSRNTMWTQAELLHSLGPSLKNDSYYLVSYASLPIIAPLKQDNASNPRITFVLPSEKTNFSQDVLEMYQIECTVLDTKTINLVRRGLNQFVEQEDEDTRIEIEV